MSGEFCKTRLARMHDVLQGHVARGEVPGLVSLISRCGETHVETLGVQSLDGGVPMRRDTIFRIASMTKPIVAVAALMLIEECVFGLDEPVDRFLPELASPKVLRCLESEVTDTVPAHRPITVRDLLTFRLGTGFVMAFPSKYPVQKAIADAGLAPGPKAPDLTNDEYMRRIASVPLIYQPGTRWLYHTGSDVLGVLIARAAGKALGDFLRERIFEPLGMKDTGFTVPASDLARLPTAYRRDPEKNALVVADDARDSRFSRPAPFHSGGGGLVSTADDYFAFFRMMLNKGQGTGPHGRERIVSRAAIELMTTDQLTAEQKTGTELFFGQSRSWGMGVAVTTKRDELWGNPGRYGWDGGYGTTAFADPSEDMVGILLTQRSMESPVPPRIYTDFFTTAYAALND
jgi:CubicO group peptidase (beta-lactamase class C family)